MEGYDYEYDSDGRRHKVPVAQSYHNLRYSKKAAFRSIFRKIWGLRVTVSFRQSTKLLEYGGYQYPYQLGYASGWQGISYSLSWSWSESVGSSGADRILAFNMSVPFSVLTGRRYARDTILDRTYATFNANRNRDGDNSWQTGVGGTLLEGRNLSYSVTQGRSSSNGYSGSASASWQATYGTLGVGYNYDRDQHDYNWQLSGGVVGHADGITFSQPLGDTNVLIKAPGAKGVRIENQTGVKTDWRGYAVMPYATVYRYNRVALDTNTMDNHTDVENNVSSVVPTEGALVRAAFDTRIGVRAIITARLGGRPLPFGAIVRETASGITSMVGDDGQFI